MLLRMPRSLSTNGSRETLVTQPDDDDRERQERDEDEGDRQIVDPERRDGFRCKDQQRKRGERHKRDFGDQTIHRTKRGLGVSSWGQADQDGA